MFDTTLVEENASCPYHKMGVLMETEELARLKLPHAVPWSHHWCSASGGEPSHHGEDGNLGFSVDPN